MYRVINFEKVIGTLSKLHQRIEERFPDTGLIKVCIELQVIVNETEDDLIQIAKPNYWLRGVVSSIIIMVFLFVVVSINNIDFQSTQFTLVQFVQVGESAINDIVLFGLAIFFLTSLESKLKINKVVKSLNGLRTISHIIDMHQLTKDPTELGEQANKTASSPKRNITVHELKRYLDYCSEMLAIVGKIAAIYAQHIPEKTVVSAVNEIENLTSGISQKIWQKIVILEQVSTKSIHQHNL